MIYIHKGDDTDFNDNSFLTFNIVTEKDLTGWQAKFILNGLEKTFEDITSKSFELHYSDEETSQFKLGKTTNELRLIDEEGKIKTVAKNIEISVTCDVIENESQLINLPILKDEGIDINISLASNSGGTTNHNELLNRELADQHPIKAITNLQETLDKKANKNELSNLATKDEVNAKASISDMTNYIEAHKDELKGADGKDGKDGTNGKDGYTPVKGVDYFDGAKGDKGDKGEQGIQGPKGEDGINGINGTDGKDGANGKDGVSVTHSWNGTTLNVTSASGTSSANLKGDKGEQGDKGADGYTPIKGIDYYTEADKAEVAQEASKLIDLTGYATEKYVDDAIDGIDIPSGVIAQAEAPADKKLLWVDTDDETQEVEDCASREYVDNAIKNIKIPSVADVIEALPKYNGGVS